LAYFSVLDSLDSSSASLLGTKRKPEDLKSVVDSNLNLNEGYANQDEESPYDWSRQHDYTTNHDYYYNHRTGVSQWERPNGYIDSEVVYSNTSVSQLGTDAYSNADPYAVKASFTSKSGRFSQTGPSSYWEKVTT